MEKEKKTLAEILEEEEEDELRWDYRLFTKREKKRFFQKRRIIQDNYTNNVDRLNNTVFPLPTRRPPPPRMARSEVTPEQRRRELQKRVEDPVPVQQIASVRLPELDDRHRHFVHEHHRLRVRVRPDQGHDDARHSVHLLVRVHHFGLHRELVRRQAEHRLRGRNQGRPGQHEALHIRAGAGHHRQNP